MSGFINPTVRSAVSRRGLLGAAGLGMGALALAGCSGPDVSGEGGSGAQEETDWSAVEPATEISFWTNHPGGSMELEQGFADAFKAETGIQVNLVTAGKNYEEVLQKFLTAQTGDDAGDLVVVSDVTWFTYYINGTILALDGLWDHLQFEIDDYRDALIADYLYEDQHYGVPYSRSTPLFYYNKDHWSKAGLDDAAPKTWAEFDEMAAQLVDASGNDAAFAYPKQDQYPGWTLSNVVWGWGGGWSDEWDTSVLVGDETVAAMQFVQDSVQKSQWGMVASSDHSEIFAAGGVSAIVQSTGSMNGIMSSADGFEIGVGFLPGGPQETDNVCPTGGAGVGISAKSSPERQLAAAMFVQFMTNPENSATFAEGTGYMPVRKSADMSAAIAETPQLSVAVDQLDHTRSQDYVRVLLAGGDLNLSGTLQTIMTSEVDVKAELEKLRGVLDDLYETDLKPQLEG